MGRNLGGDSRPHTPTRCMGYGLWMCVLLSLLGSLLGAQRVGDTDRDVLAVDSKTMEIGTRFERSLIFPRRPAWPGRPSLPSGPLLLHIGHQIGFNLHFGLIAPRSCTESRCQVPPLAALTSLEELRINGCVAVTDLGPVESLMSLETHWVDRGAHLVDALPNLKPLNGRTLRCE